MEGKWRGQAPEAAGHVGPSIRKQSDKSPLYTFSRVAYLKEIREPVYPRLDSGSGSVFAVLSSWALKQQLWKEVSHLTLG